MAEEQKNGLAEALETGASVAHLARGAIKAGKAVSGAAKGAAAGGPYGAAAGALWEGRKSVGVVRQIKRRYIRHIKTRLIRGNC